MARVQYGSLPFKEAVSFFRGKLNLSTASWTDIWQGQHATAFTVAGAMKEDLLVDLRRAVDSAIAGGTTLQQFRKDFDTLVAKHGWAYNGGRNWRTRVIFETNLYQAYNAGRYEQMQAIKTRRPYWRYRHNDAVTHPRPEHLSWNNLVLAADDPWWDTHMPQNGWGCKCFVQTLSERDMRRLGKQGPDQAPAIEYEEKTVGLRGPNPRTVQVPKGIDPGFAYNPGQAAVGKQLAADAMDEWRATRDAWQLLNPEGWAEVGRPARIPLNPPPVALGPRLTDQAAVSDALRQQLGGESRLYQPGGVPVQVHAGALGDHLDPARTQYLPLLDDLLTNPYEVWLAWEQHQGTGQVRLRSRIIKGYELGKGKLLLLVGHARKGYLEGWTFIPTSDRKYINRLRAGELLYHDK